MWDTDHRRLLEHYGRDIEKSWRRYSNADIDRLARSPWGVKYDAPNFLLCKKCSTIPTVPPEQFSMLIS